MSIAPLTIGQSAQLLGRFRYVELELHRRIGTFAGSPGLAGQVAPPLLAAARVWLAGAGMAHSWRAEQLRALLPVSIGLPGARELTCAPAPQRDLALDLATAPTLEVDALLAGLVEVVYPSMVEGYGQRLKSASPACDPPVTRVLGRLVADLENVRRGGAELIAAGRDSSVTDRLRDSLTQAGGIFGSLH